jgi:hypothetical protein
MKRSGRDESTWVVTYLYMEAMLGISLYSCPYLNQQKHYVFLIIASLQQNWRKGQNRFCLEARGVERRGKGEGDGEGEMTQTMYACMNICIKKKKE